METIGDYSGGHTPGPSGHSVTPGGTYICPVSMAGYGMGLGVMPYVGTAAGSGLLLIGGLSNQLSTGLSRRSLWYPSLSMIQLLFKVPHSVVLCVIHILPHPKKKTTEKMEKTKPADWRVSNAAVTLFCILLPQLLHHRNIKPFRIKRYAKIRKCTFNFEIQLLFKTFFKFLLGTNSIFLKPHLHRSSQTCSYVYPLQK